MSGSGKGIEINGDAVQVFTPNGSIASATSFDVKSILVWVPETDTTYEYDTGDFALKITAAAGVPVGVPREATTLTLGTASAIGYMSR